MLQPRRTIGVRDLKARASSVLHEIVADGVEYIVTLHGRPIARIEPMATLEPGKLLDGMGSTRGTLAALPQTTFEDFEALDALWRPRSPDRE